MKQFKFLICCALLSSFVLVGCGDDEDDVTTPTLELGEFTSTRFVATGCTDETDNEDGPTPCDSADGCVKLVLDEDLTVELLIQDELNPVPALFLEGTYFISGENITMELGESGFELLWEGVIVGSTEIRLSRTDEDLGCLETTTFSK